MVIAWGPTLLSLVYGERLAAMQGTTREESQTTYPSNRPWPVPDEPWVMAQKWRNLLFAHWPIPLSELRPHVPEQLPIDTFNGSAWVGVTPFVLEGLRSRYLPPIPRMSRFPEINVRTYVTVDGKPGVFFFSLDAASRSAVIGARLTYRLPYFFSRASVEQISDGVDYRSTRDDARGYPATFRAQYRPSGDVFHAEPGTLEYFLAERYCLYSHRQGERFWRAEIDHVPWPLQTAEVDIRHNTMTTAAGLVLPPREPIVHFSRFIDVRIWKPERISDRELRPDQYSDEPEEPSSTT